MNEENQIDQYLLGQLDPEALDTFQKKLLTDTELALAVKKRQVMLDGFEALGNQKMRNHIQVVRKEMLASKEVKASASTSPRSNFVRLFWLVLALILLILVGLYFFNPSDSPDRLFQQAYQVPPLSLSTRDLDGDELTIQAESYYASKEYSSAISLLQQISAKHPEESDLKIAIGNAHLVMGQVEEAIPYFKSIIQSNDALFVDQARWYLALCYLKQDEIAKSKELLNILTNDAKADFHKEAIMLLSKM